jgi:hypothetical protein
MMDKDVLDRQLQVLCQNAVAEARAAVEQASDGQWIAASEWQVRDIFQRLTRDSYQLMLQAKADAHPTADEAVFSPGGCGPGLGNQSKGGLAKQGKASSAGVVRCR